MTPKYRYKNGERAAKVTLKVFVSATMIEQAVHEAIYSENELTRTSIDKWIKFQLYDRGRTWFDYGFWDDHGSVSDKAVEKAKELFPEFYGK